MQRFKLVRERGIICHQKIYQSGSFSVENSHIKGLGIGPWGGAFLYKISLHTLRSRPFSLPRFCTYSSKM